MTNYRYYTRKQAGIVYAAIKRGDLTASDKFVKALYNDAESTERVDRILAVNRIIDHVINNRFDLAQAEVNGCITDTVPVKTVTRRPATEEDGEVLFGIVKVGEMHDFSETTFEWAVTTLNNGF